MGPAQVHTSLVLRFRNTFASIYEEKCPDTVNKLLLNTYADDVQSGGDGKEELLKFKEEATEIIGEGEFQLHKWHSI